MRARLSQNLIAAVVMLAQVLDDSLEWKSSAHHAQVLSLAKIHGAHLLVQNTSIGQIHTGVAGFVGQFRDPKKTIAKKLTCISLAVQKHINKQRTDLSHARENMVTRVCCISFSKSFLACSSGVNSFLTLGVFLSVVLPPLGAPKSSVFEEGVLAILVWSALTTLNLWALFPGIRACPVNPIPVLVSSALVSSIRSNTLYKRFFGLLASWGCGFPT